MTGRRGARRAAAVGCLVVAAMLAGCTSARNTLGTNSSQCYKAVAVTSDAVHDRGTFVGIRLLSARQVSRYHHLEVLLRARAPAVKTVCVAAYHGSYRLDQVQMPFGAQPANGGGPIAIVVVSTPQNKLIGTIVLSRIPLPIRHEVLRRTPARPPAAPTGSEAARPQPAGA